VEVEVEGALPLSRKGKGKTKGKMKVKAKAKEHVSMLNSKMRTDNRPMDLTCTCYTCRPSPGHTYITFSSGRRHWEGPSLQSITSTI
jgi:hypothetical protein